MGGDCLKYLKREWNRKEGRWNKDFKKGGQTGSRGGCLKKGGGGAGTPLRTMMHTQLLQYLLKSIFFSTWAIFILG